jgi:hypothetical protein
LSTDSAEDVIVVGEMGLAVLAAVDTRRVEVDVVREPHDGGAKMLRCRSVALSNALDRRQQVTAAYRIAVTRAWLREAGRGDARGRGCMQGHTRRLRPNCW